MSDTKGKKPHPPKKKLKGVLLKIAIPAGTVVNILNLLEISSPEGIGLLIRVPFLKGSSKLNSVMESITAAGGTVEIVEE